MSRPLILWRATINTSVAWHHTTSEYYGNRVLQLNTLRVIIVIHFSPPLSSPMADVSITPQEKDGNFNHLAALLMTKLPPTPIEERAKELHGLLTHAPKQARSCFVVSSGKRKRIEDEPTYGIKRPHVRPRCCCLLLLFILRSVRMVGLHVQGRRAPSKRFQSGHQPGRCGCKEPHALLQVKGKLRRMRKPEAGSCSKQTW